MRNRMISKPELKLPVAPRPLGRYAALSEANGVVYLSGMLPIEDGRAVFTGHCDMEKGRRAAELATLNGLAVLQEYFGTLEKIRRVVRVAVFIAAGTDFRDHAFVADGCSEILNRFFPETEPHARLAFGVSSLPLNAAVELELIFQIREEKI